MILVFFATQNAEDETYHEVRLIKQSLVPN